MRRILSLLAVLGLASLPVPGSSFFVSPDVPTDRAASTYLPWDIVRNDSGIYSVPVSLPPNTPLNALHGMCSGDWLISVEAPTDLPAAGPTFEARDLLRYDPTLPTYNLFYCGGPVGIPAGAEIDAAFLDGNDSADLVLSFDVPTDLTAIGGGVYDPADLVRFFRVAPGCAGWNVAPLPYFDASAALPPVVTAANVTGGDRRGIAPNVTTVLTFDVPTTLGAPTYLPGELVSWNGVTFASFHLDGTWPISSRADAFSFLPDPGSVPSMHVDKSLLTAGDLTVTWTTGSSAGAEDYGIYEGSVGSWYTHTRIDCSDGGVPLSEDVTPAAGDRYYLVVPLNPNDEGSYGQHSSGAERPVGSATCRPTQGLDCP